MQKRSFAVAAIWLAGVVLYIALSAGVAHLFNIAMLQWARSLGRVNLGTQIEFLMLRRPVFVLCLLWGVLYASALAKPAAFGGAPRVFKHLGWSYVLGAIGCVFPARIAFMPLPDFQSTTAASVFIVVAFSFSIICIIAAIAAWVRLAFATIQGSITQRNASQHSPPSPLPR